jgi:hypothetical protein
MLQHKLKKITESEEIQLFRQKHDIMGQEINENMAELKSIRHEVKVLKRSYIVMLCANLSVALILTFISSLFFICSTDTKKTPINPINEIIILTIIQLFLYCLTSYLAMRLTISKKKIIAQSKYETIDFSENKYKAEYPIAKMIKRGFNSFFSNATLGSILIGVLLFTVYFWISAMPQSSTIQQKQFKTLSIDNIQYVVIYSNTEKMVLEEATFSGGIATIYTSKQRVVFVDAYPFEVVTFQKTILMNNSTS